jgi:hypothetical protein
VNKLVINNLAGFTVLTPSIIGFDLEPSRWFALKAHIDGKSYHAEKIFFSPGAGMVISAVIALIWRLEKTPALWYVFRRYPYITR